MWPCTLAQNGGGSQRGAVNGNWDCRGLAEPVFVGGAAVLSPRKFCQEPELRASSSISSRRHHRLRACPRTGSHPELLTTNSLDLAGTHSEHVSMSISTLVHKEVFFLAVVPKTIAEPAAHVNTGGRLFLNQTFGLAKPVLPTLVDSCSPRSQEEVFHVS